MANDHHEDDSPSGRYEQLMQSELDAAKGWSNIAARIADALEHQVIAQLMMQLTALQLETSAPRAQHRVDCPGCTLMRNARPAKIITPNGGSPIIGR